MTPANEPGNTVWWSVLGALCAILLAPFALSDVPPLLDYPNHLARMFVLAFVDGDPVLARFYRPHWDIIPNLLLDLTVPPLLRLFPVHLVGRAVAGLILILPVLGAVAYHRAVTGRRSFWPFAAVLFAFNGAYLRGFLNFAASVGLAMLFAALWVAWRDKRPGLALLSAAIGAVVLFFSHLTGLVFFAVLIGAHDLAWLGTRPRFGAIVARAASGLAVFVAPAILYASSDLSGVGGVTWFRTPEDKLLAALFPVTNYIWPLDLATGLAVVAIAALCLARRWCVVRPRDWIALAVLVALFAGLPHAFKRTFDLDTRFIIMAAALAPAALVPLAIPRRAATAIACGLLLLFSARMAVLATVWDEWADDLAAFRRVIAPVEPGDVVLTVRLPRPEERLAWPPPSYRLSDGGYVDAHLPALLVIEHRAWWPFLFDIPSQQPIETKRPFHILARDIDFSRDPIALLARGGQEMRLLTHVLVQGPPALANGLTIEGLHRIAGNRAAALFAIESGWISPADAPGRPAVGHVARPPGR